jgi:hypothetical protein
MWAERRILNVKSGGAYSYHWVLEGKRTVGTALTLKGVVLPTQCIYIFPIVLAVNSDCFINIIRLPLLWR